MYQAIGEFLARFFMPGPSHPGGYSQDEVCYAFCLTRKTLEDLSMPSRNTPHSPHFHGTPIFGMQKTFISEMVPPQELSGPAWWFGFHRNLLPV